MRHFRLQERFVPTPHQINSTSNKHLGNRRSLHKNGNLTPPLSRSHPDNRKTQQRTQTRSFKSRRYVEFPTFISFLGMLGGIEEKGFVQSAVAIKCICTCGRGTHQKPHSFPAEYHQYAQRMNRIPQQKYSHPMTTAQGYGWDVEPLVGSFSVRLTGGEKKQK